MRIKVNTIYHGLLQIVLISTTICSEWAIFNTRILQLGTPNAPLYQTIFEEVHLVSYACFRINMNLGILL